MFGSVQASANNLGDSEAASPSTVGIESNGGSTASDTKQTATAAKHADPAMDALLDRIQAAAADVKTLQARVRYDTESQLTGDSQRRFGQLKYIASENVPSANGSHADVSIETEAAASPTRFWVHFHVLFLDGQQAGRDTDQTYVFDGQTLAEIDRQAKTYQRFVLNTKPGQDPFKMGEGPLPLPFQLDKADLLARFDIQDTDETGPEGAVGLALTPKPAVAQDMDADIVYLWFDADNLHPIQARADRLAAGEIKTVRLLRPEWNATLDDANFNTNPPAEAVAPAWSIHDETK